MKKLWIDPGCITCGMCEFIAPKVFEVTDVSHIKSDCDLKSATLGLQGACQATHENEPGFASKKDAPA